MQRHEYQRCRGGYVEQSLDADLPASDVSDKMFFARIQPQLD